MKRLVVMGDAVLDRDVMGRTERVAPDAPVPVLDVDLVRESPGGAGLAALLCAAPGVEVELIAPIADDEPGRRLLSMLRARMSVLPLPHVGGTRLKTRLRSAGQSLLRMDEGGPGAPDEPDLDAVAHALSRADVVLVSDYGAGTTHHPGLRDLLTQAAARGTPVVWDPHPRGANPVPGVHVVTPNLAEAVRAAAELPGEHATPEELAEALRVAWNARAVCLTAGAGGAFLAMPAREPMVAPAPQINGGDPCGAGDRFAASVAISLAAGALVSEAVVTAVQHASAWVGAGGAAAFREPADVHDGGQESAQIQDQEHPVPSPQALLQAEPSDLPDASALIETMRARGGKIVATGGCFDILHVGHIRCLADARKLGDALIVLLNSDDSVRRLKGPGRPVVNERERARMLSALESVDAVIVFDEDSPEAALDRIRPDIWVKGGDYGAAPLPEAGLVRSWGGRVLLLPYADGYSSTTILERLAEPPLATDHSSATGR